MNAVVHVVSAAVVYDVHVIVISPTHWPRLDKSEVVAAVCETMTVIVSAVHMEAVTAAKACTVMRLCNPAVRAVVTSAVVRSRRV